MGSALTPALSHEGRGSLHRLLKQHFGYDEFRPQQEAIIGNALAGRHSLVIMPTGGGKSLCYQLPALARGGLTLVVSPLIALMKDQVDGLRANGVAAEFINSSLNNYTAGQVERRAQEGKVSLLYVAPERVSQPGFQRFMNTLDLRLIAIDEAHCISEWGHDFRPDYRTLSELRKRFPDTPLMALTATATERVQDDIVEQLQLGDCQRFVSSFDRANLNYLVRPRQAAWDSLLGLLAERQGQSAIIYCFSRKETEEVAEGLTASGHPALAYHAGLDAETRRRTQERFIDGEVPVVAATIAFGMGIDKPDIRLVVHYALPKSVEGYYQETGRAGRDGDPSDCVLFFSEGDRAKQEYFIQRMTDGYARAAAEQQLQKMVDYGRLNTCRRQYLLGYFGEAMAGDSCGSCDVCLAERRTVDVTEVAQKLLSAVIRTGERFGIAYVNLVLLGSRDQRITESGHDRLSVFGIVDNYDRNGLRKVADGLVEKGLLRREAGQYATIGVTAAGREWLRSRDSLTLELRVEEATERSGRRSKPPASHPVAHDTGLFEELRALRRRLADEQGVPAFVVFSDATLRELASASPISGAAMLRVSGVGPAKLERYGDKFLAVIREYAGGIFSNGAQATPDLPGNDGSTFVETDRRGEDGGGKPLGITHITTQRLLQQGLTVDEIAKERGLSSQTVLAHVERIVSVGEAVDLGPMLPSSERTARIRAALQATGDDRLAPVKELLGDDYSYEEIRLVNAFIKMQNATFCICGNKKPAIFQSCFVCAEATGRITRCPRCEGYKLARRDICSHCWRTENAKLLIDDKTYNEFSKYDYLDDQELFLENLLDDQPELEMYIDRPSDKYIS